MWWHYWLQSYFLQHHWVWLVQFRELTAAWPIQCLLISMINGHGHARLRFCHCNIYTKTVVFAICPLSNVDLCFTPHIGVLHSEFKWWKSNNGYFMLNWLTFLDPQIKSTKIVWVIDIWNPLADWLHLLLYTVWLW